MEEIIVTTYKRLMEEKSSARSNKPLFKQVCSLCSKEFETIQDSPGTCSIECSFTRCLEEKGECRVHNPSESFYFFEAGKKVYKPLTKTLIYKHYNPDFQTTKFGLIQTCWNKECLNIQHMGVVTKAEASRFLDDIYKKEQAAIREEETRKSEARYLQGLDICKYCSGEFKVKELWDIKWEQPLCSFKCFFFKEIKSHSFNIKSGGCLVSTRDSIDYKGKYSFSPRQAARFIFRQSLEKMDQNEWEKMAGKYAISRYDNGEICRRNIKCVNPDHFEQLDNVDSLAELHNSMPENYRKMFRFLVKKNLMNRAVTHASHNKTCKCVDCSSLLIEILAMLNSFESEIKE